MHNCYYEKIGNNAPVKLEDLPFDIPDNWTWIRQKNICWLDNGTKTKGNKLPYLEAKVIRGQSDPIYLDEGVIVNPSHRVILVDGENSGEIMTPPFKGYMGSTFKIFSAISQFNYNYLLCIFSLNKDKYKNSKTGVAIPHLNKNLFKESYIAVPPFIEQERIFNRIDQIESLLFNYENIEEKLSVLEQEFPEKLKKSILQYAIEGKLVKQNPNDEPASILLERIKAEKEKLIKEGKIKRDKNESYIYQGDDKNYYEKKDKKIAMIDVPFSIPSLWIFERLSNACKIVNGFTPLRSNPAFWDGDINWMTVDDINKQGKYISSTIQHITINAMKSNERVIPSGSTFICCTSATIGKTCINNVPMCSNQQFNGIVIKDTRQLNNEYLYYFCSTLKKKLLELAGITTFPFVSVDKLSKILIPIPPANQQKLIVNKIKLIENLIQSN